MLRDRKRFNYLNERTLHRANCENTPISTPHSDKRIIQLEANNKKLIAETSQQFHKFQEDLLHVEDILAEKETTIQQLKCQKDQIQTQRNTLVQSLEKKDTLIAQLYEQINQLKKEPIVQEEGESQTENNVAQAQTQTQEPEQEEDTFKDKYDGALAKAFDLEEQVYKLKEELFKCSSELGLVQQQFSSYKLLKQIDNIKNND